MYSDIHPILAVTHVRAEQAYCNVTFSGGKKN